jgi:exodeoxyribonuclease VII large subunit
MEVFSLCSFAKQEIKQLARNMKRDAVSRLKQVKLVLDQNIHLAIKSTKVSLATKDAEMKNIEKNINNLSPQNVLRRGYSITLRNGKALKSYQETKAGDKLNTILFEGKLISIVESTKKSKPL